MDSTVTQQWWQDTATIRAEIDRLPFLNALADGTLGRSIFVEYLAQDAHYLRDYGRVMAMLSAIAPTRKASVFWATTAAESLETEQLLHDSHLSHITAENFPAPSPTCMMYTSFLLAEATRGNYATLSAAVLPCFCVYDDVGRRLAARVRATRPHETDLAWHPYGDWISTYEDDAFSAAAANASALVNEAAITATAAVRARMREVYIMATRCEWMFWHAAWRQERWPV
ncbi:TenA family protein [Dermatophilus congolensis]|uniref:TenA family protein n=1 Tax=Dermatophilus congolensis TaxID=1863 RepID=UPI001AAEF256|nr:TenA family protein [Dermatophilus congolensis]MBO3143466.1 thiaminase II [Dermatophilus congolensis]MBO3152456.1 thiaminase II [Dermatophilus congolensis]MBO3160532.1 thiaminase II [Dermatophilus congolensis]MBO3163743.1 thiaminase II [Dermatophilus congolensis]MBO3177289.1 thiaminase II [Dermatophilus congolensis]